MTTEIAIKVLGVSCGLASLVLAALAGWSIRGKDAEAEIARLQQEWAGAREAAVVAARTEERLKQEKINDVLREQNRRTAAVAASLAADLERVRQRPARRPAAGVSEGAGTACAGANGAELSSADAEFLVRLAARADEQRIALRACYKAWDEMRGEGGRLQ